MKRLAIVLLSLTVTIGTLVSCSVTKHCNEPDITMPKEIAEGLRTDSLTIADMEWWEFYGDSTLCYIIERTLENNKDILAAAARV